MPLYQITDLLYFPYLISWFTISHLELQLILSETGHTGDFEVFKLKKTAALKHFKIKYY
jgi:hypothetical protein